MFKRKSIVALALSVMALWGAESTRADDLVIVMGAGSATPNLTAAEMSKVFRGEKSKNADGKKFVIVMREVGSPERNSALAGIYSMTEQEFKTYFLQATFTGTVAAAPKTQNSVEAMKAYLAKTPGAIGYVMAKDVDATLQIVKIDGKGPVDDGYKLKGK